MEGEYSRVEKLQKAEDWPEWKFEIRVLLNAAEVMDVVSGKDERPQRASFSTDVEHLTAMKSWQKSDNKAQRIIVTALGRQPKIHLLNCTTSNSMWLKLESVFEKKSAAQKHLVSQSFFDYKKSPDDDMATFISKLRAIVKQMTDLGETVSDHMVVTKIVMSLPSEYGHFASAWESTAVDQQTVDNLTSRLIMEEARIKQKNQVEATEALIASRFRPKNLSGKPGKCHICKKVGHWKNECPSKKAKVEENQSSGSNSTKHSRKPGDACLAVKAGNFFGKANAFLSLNEAMSAEYRKNDEQWYLDSGASDHMSFRSDWFADYQPFEQDLPVRIGDGSYIYAKGFGNIDILAYDNCNWNKKHLSDVLYVPEIHLNLFSQGKALDKDMVLTSDKEKCVFSRDGVRILVGKREKNLFKLAFEVIGKSKNSKMHVEKTETTLEGNSEDRRWAESSNSKHKSCNLTEGNVSQNVSISTWHERFGHQNVSHVKQFLRHRNVGFDAQGEFFCESCMYGKQHRLPFTRSDNRAGKVGELVHADVCGPMPERSISGARYFLLLKDDFSNFRKVFFMKEKSEVCRKIEKYFSLVKSVNCTVLVVRSDNGTEFVNVNVDKLLEENAVRHQRSVVYTPQHNGRAERDMRTIVEAARTMLHSKRLPLKFWAEAVNTAVYILNCTGPSSVKDKTPYELFYKKEPTIGHLKIFGSTVFVHVPKEKRKKWSKKSKKGIFLGYCDETKGYRIWITEENKVEVARDVVFKENLPFNESIVSENPSNREANNFAIFGPEIFGDDNENSLASCNGINVESQQANEGQNNLSFMSAMSDQSMDEPIHVEDFMELDSNDESQSSKEDGSNQSFVSDRTRIRTYLAETMEVGNCFVSAKNRNVIDNKWVYKVKEKPSGEIERYKARLVVRGFTQEHGVDYNQTFSPVVRYTSIRTIVAIAAAENLKLRKFDVHTAFLYGLLAETIYMKQPIGYEDGTDRVCLLRKSLYGLKQASRNWNQKFTKFLKSHDLQITEADQCVFVRYGARRLILGIFIDDGLVAAKTDEEIDELMEILQNEFKIRISEADCFVGLEINRREDGTIHLSQMAYTKRILEKFRMSDANSQATPAESNLLATTELATNYPFREAIGSLMYLAVGTRPDISFAVGRCSRNLCVPTTSDVTAVKRIFKYLCGTKDLGIVYKRTDKFIIECFSDSDYAGCSQTRRSTTGYVFNLGSGAISWCSQLQKSVVTSTTEAEYVAAAQSVKEMVWIRRLVSNLHVDCDSVYLRVDNISAIRLVENCEPHKRTKHVDVKYHFIREKFERGLFQLEHVSTDLQVADILTKPLARVKFEKFRELMGLSK